MTFKITYNEEAKAFIKAMRKMIKPSGYRLQVRGRGYRQGIKRYRQELPLRFATSVAVYVKRKNF